VSVYVRVDIGNEVLSSGSEAWWLISATVSTIRKRTTGCIFCEHKYRTNDSLAISNSFFLGALLATSNTCDENALINHLKTLNTMFNGRNFKASLMSAIGKSLNISVAIVSEEQVPNPESFLPVPHYRCTSILSLTSKYACPYVEEHESSKHVYEASGVNLEDLAEVLFVGNTTVYRVCLSDLTAALSFAVRLGQTTMTLLITSVLIAMLIL